MELVLETLKEKEFYLQHRLSKYDDFPEIQEVLKKDIKSFQQTIDIVELHINIVNKNKNERIKS